MAGVKGCSEGELGAEGTGERVCLEVLQGIMESFLEERQRKRSWKIHRIPPSAEGSLQALPALPPAGCPHTCGSQPDLGDTGSNPDSSIYPQVSLLWTSSFLICKMGIRVPLKSWRLLVIHPWPSILAGDKAPLPSTQNWLVKPNRCPVDTDW